MLWLMISSVFAYDPSVAQGHTGILTPITSAPAPIATTDAENTKLQAGEVVLRSAADDSGEGRGVAVQYVSAPESVVWDTILNYPMYTEWVDNVVQSSVYKTAPGKCGDQNLHVELISSVMFVKFGVYTINYLCKEQHYMHWTLDYDRQSDTKDMVGYWRVEQISTNPPVTRVDYATEMLVTGVPDFLASYLTKDALINGTKWVKREAEKATK